MPIKHAAIKHQRQTKKRTAKNRLDKASVKNVVKSVRKAIGLKDKTKAAEALRKAVKALDQSAQKKVITKNKAARLKSRLAHQVNKL
jgi:small subunit ribosomal protein S20